MSKNFAITGVAGYIAPRHLKAIRETGNCLVAAVDPNDSVGILDGYFDDVKFFTEFERFDRHVDKLRRVDAGKQIHYLTVCSPNYLHDAHARLALRVGADVICEKPVVLNPWNIDALQELEQESGKKVFTVLQLRVHPSLLALKEKLAKEKPGKRHQIELTYITSRGNWYLVSWKGQVDRSGGLATNIGIHFFDLLIWLFGSVKMSRVDFASAYKTCGRMELGNADVTWYLSIDKGDLRLIDGIGDKATYRSITVDGQEIEFSGGFTDLHTVVYKQTLAGKGFTLEDARPSIQIAHDIRVAQALGIDADSHPLGKNTV